MILNNIPPTSMRWLAGRVCAIFFLATIESARAQDDASSISASPIAEWKPEYYLVAAFCLLGFVIIALQFVLLLKVRQGVTADEIIRAFSTTLILIGVVALLGIGYNEKQVQPALALFGTLLGYLMGRGESNSDTRGLPRPEPRGKSGAPETLVKSDRTGSTDA